MQRRNFFGSSLSAGFMQGTPEPQIDREYPSGGTGGVSYQTPITIERKATGKPHAGKVLAAIGVPGAPSPYLSGEPFHRCTHTALAPTGELYVSDGYGNARVHKYSPDGRLLLSWGSPGTDPGHTVKVTPGTLLHRLTGVAEIPVNSAHHQAVKAVGPQAAINAVAPDGVIEGIESKIHRFCLGVQWHPEFHITASDTKLFAGLIAAARA